MDVTGRRCVRGSKVSPRVIAELSSLCCLPPICMLLFQPDPALPTTSRYWLFCHRLHLEILRHIHSLTSGTISVSACTLNNKARGNFFQDFFFFLTFTSLISMPLGALTSARWHIRLCRSLSLILELKYKASPMLWHRSLILCMGRDSPCPKDSLPFTPVVSHFISITTGNTKIGHWGLWRVCVPRSHERFSSTSSGICLQPVFCPVWNVMGELITLAYWYQMYALPSFLH